MDAATATSAATNPMVSMPDLHRVRAGLAKAELVVVSDAYHPTETTRVADVVLPVIVDRDVGLAGDGRRDPGFRREAIRGPGRARVGRRADAGECRLCLAPARNKAASADRDFRPAPRRYLDAGRRPPAGRRVSRVGEIFDSFFAQNGSNWIRKFRSEDP